MKRIVLLPLVVMIIAYSSCSSSKTYFSNNIKDKVEASGTPLTKLQYYIDRDVELSREVLQGETKVTSGVLRVENGKNLNIITLKKNTPGVCLKTQDGKLLISFEDGENKYLTFGKTKYATNNDPFRVLANSWIGNYGLITYEGKQYFIHSGGDASIMIKTSELNMEQVNKHKMKGRTIS
ncbi:hypothetical protein [Parasediminibacterium sp. JCM 36343]|uniref:hypothetical protein n=1 Tax=Parasediminibacterium sp. JCM 36343 TaxID=3374279 RepID=UPI00397824FE